MPEGAVYVGRGSKYGNPYTIEEYGRDKAIELHAQFIERMRKFTPNMYAGYMGDLRGKDLCCWCKPGDMCHADLLLAHANT